MVYPVDKAGDVRGDGSLILRVFHPRRQFQLPVLLKRFKLAILAVSEGGILQLFAEDGGVHFVEQLAIARVERDCRQQTVALHSQRTGLIDRVRAALYAVYQTGRDTDSCDANRCR